MKVSEDKLTASLCRESFYDFLQEFWTTIGAGKPHLNWHLKFLCDELQILAEDVFARREKRYDLIVNIPPGSSKSTIISHMFPAWCWTRDPTLKLLCASYADDIALRDSGKSRDIIQSDLYKSCFPNIILRDDQNTKSKFVNTLKGERWAVATGGRITGAHGHILIVDDPLNPNEARSDLLLIRASQWMTGTFESRRMPPADQVPLILVQQRLAQNDPTGDLLERSKGKGIRHICLPAELTDDVSPREIVSMYVDGLLDPVRMSRKTLEGIRERMGDYGYASQYLETPIPPGGGTFKTSEFIRFDEAPPGIVRLVRSWDKAGTKDGGAYSVGALLGVDNKNFVTVLDVVRGQWDSTKREEMILATAEEDGLDVEILLEVENGSGGKESAQSTMRNLAGFRVRAFKPTGDKESRAYPFSVQVGARNVGILNRHWTRAFLEELSFFPHSRYKDQVDASSAAFNRLFKRKRRVGGFRKKT